MTTAELLWLVHAEHMEYLRENEPGKMRPYLIATADDDALIAWDKEQMAPKKTGGAGTSRSPRRRR